MKTANINFNSRMLKVQHLASLGHSVAPEQVEIVSINFRRLTAPPFTTYIASPRATRPVQCHASHEDGSGASSTIVARASKTVDTWLSEDFDFNNFYDEDGTNNERSVSLYKFPK